MGVPSDIEIVQTDARAIDTHTPPLYVREEKPGGKKPWYYYVWDTLDKPKEERWFMFKLDAALLTFASLGTYTQRFLPPLTGY
jgi:ACS family pantothenate transporter-like MFS transporter